MIQAIDRESIKRICSGQVVVDLATAVKEMVENSLDSGATSVEIKLKEMGSESIEVSDNGCGIHPSNYANIALKHHTSKLSNFNDLNSVASFGFRGEALNALCELSGAFTVITKLESQEIGCRLNFGSNGSITSKTQIARTTGTTVIVTNLFEALPVRRGEFLRSIKKQYQKMIKVLQSYAIIAVGVRILVTNTGKGSKQIVIGTQMSNTMADNIGTIFGSSFLSSLIPLSITIDVGAVVDVEADVEVDVEAEAEVDVEVEEVLMSVPLSNTTQESSLVNISGCSEDCIPVTVTAEAVKVAQQCTVNGFISKVGVGVGRGDNERQFMFCNGRPVDLSKFVKAVNEVWRKYEMKHKPACVLDIRVPAGTFDVNLTPDKREIILSHEKELIEKLREEMDKMYAPSRHTFQLSQGLGSDVSSFYTSLAAAKNSTQSSSSSSSSSSKSLTSNLDTSKNEPDPVFLLHASDDVNSSSFSSSSSSSSSSSDIARSESITPNLSLFEVIEGSARLSNDGKFADVKNTESINLKYEIFHEDQSFGGDNAEKVIDVVRYENPASSFVSALSISMGPVWCTESESTLSQNSIIKESNNYSREELELSPRRHLKKKKELEESKIEGNVSNFTWNDYVDGLNARSQFDSRNYDSDFTHTAHKNFEYQRQQGENKEEQPYVQSIGGYNMIIETSSQLHLPQPQPHPVPVPFMAKAPSCEIIQVPTVWHFDSKSFLGKSRKRSASEALNGDDKLQIKSACKPTVNNDKGGEEEMLSKLSQNSDEIMKMSDIEECSDDAERRLSRVLVKNDFSSMEIVGQFNLGFIIAELRGDLFILDQHACDEKYRFETLQRSTVIHQQPLIMPLVLEATASEEIIISENIETFESNGFKIQIDQNAISGRKIKLLSVPFSKHILFGQDDVRELASLIADSQDSEGGCYISKLMLKNDKIDFNKSTTTTTTTTKKNDKKIEFENCIEVNGVIVLDVDNDNTNSHIKKDNIRDHNIEVKEDDKKQFIRIPKLVTMFASRACRSAIMIGTALQHQEMKSVVGRLETIDQPWNCPHGRPTMRHLIDIRSTRRRKGNYPSSNLLKFTSNMHTSE